MNRRTFLKSSSGFLAAASSPSLLAQVHTTAPTTRGAPGVAQPTTLPENLAWHDARGVGADGRAFDDTESYFDRLPARARQIVRPEVWNLSHHTAGMSIRFQTNAPEIYVRYAVTNEKLDMAHMPATGVSGVDLYVENEKRWRWLATVKPAQPTIVARLVDRLSPAGKRFSLNLPLYNGVRSLEIGVPKGAMFEPIAPRREGAVCIYGTSITQGGCASRPGMAFPAILSRRLDRAIYNFGFSGQGRTEPEVGALLAEIAPAPAIFIIDTLANTSADLLGERMVPLVRTLRKAHAQTPIVLMGERTWDNAYAIAPIAAYQKQKLSVLAESFRKLQDAGDHNLHLLEGGTFSTPDGESSVDGIHPTDVGMRQYADALEPVLGKLLLA